MPSEPFKEKRMKRPSKPKPDGDKDAAKSYCSPSIFEHSQARPTLEGGMPEPTLHVHVLGHELAQKPAEPSPDALALAEIALTFCMECRGWKNARGVNDWGYPYIRESVSKELANKKSPPYERQFHYTHLDKVMEAVREWMSSKDAYESAKIFDDVLTFSFEAYFVGAIDQIDVCHDLMATCVKASRSLVKGRNA
jgi:hypothetical protein